MLATKSEGNVKFVVGADVFFNPEGELCRDLSVAALSAWLSGRKSARGVVVLDALAGCGIRGLRYAVECDVSVVLNDVSKSAAREIKKNVLLNKVKRKCKVRNEDARKLMVSERFDVIDLDPFGSPASFLDTAAISIKSNGMLAITATDEAALNGSAQRAGIHKYGIVTRRTHFYTELGIRNLITSISLTCARHDKAAIPLFCFVDKHYYRAFMQVSDKKSQISEILKNIKIFYYCDKCGEFSDDFICQICGSKKHPLGPTYLGKINDEHFCEKMLRAIQKFDFKMKEKETKMLTATMSEADAPLYFDLHKLASKHKFNLNKISDVIEALKADGFSASRSALCPTGIKTNARLADLLKILKTR
jgi:tRNA (guanine26-N2/guanine27-N2)-dimethyltransferase